jgi:hypothetical protein
MKQIAATFLMLLILLQSMSTLAVRAVFLLKQKWIAKNTCENRYRPELKCGGNCVLMKKLKQQEKEESKQPGSLKLETSNIVLSSRSFFTAFILHIQQNIATQYPLIVKTGSPVDQSFSFFHPPQTAA